MSAENINRSSLQDLPSRFCSLTLAFGPYFGKFQVQKVIQSFLLWEQRFGWCFCRHIPIEEQQHSHREFETHIRDLTKSTSAGPRPGPVGSKPGSLDPYNWVVCHPQNPLKQFKTHVWGRFFHCESWPKATRPTKRTLTLAWTYMNLMESWLVERFRDPGSFTSFEGDFFAKYKIAPSFIEGGTWSMKFVIVYWPWDSNRKTIGGFI